ncbi:MAG: ParB/RepB/Spo0J family partition protein [Actinomycetaceae bacterium]|nr:ParB/RepB/Spo0J family partition protein [Actinomycetaceae bacterium]
MAASERRALGRGLGSLIPDREPIVSRETISKNEEGGRPSDLFFTGGTGRDSGERRSHSVSADLLMPKPRTSRKRSTAGGGKASGGTAGKASTGSTKRAGSKPASGKTTASRTSKRSKAKATVTEAVENTAVADSGVTEPRKPELFASIIDEAVASDTPKQSDRLPDDSVVADSDQVDSGVSGSEATDSDSSSSGSKDVGGVDADVDSAEDLAGDISELAAGEIETESEASGDEEPDLVPVPGARFAEIPVDLVVPNPKQPREIFDEFELEELADSIREIGVLQPIVVRAVDGSQERFSDIVAERSAEGIEDLPAFELIMGERRLRASKLAGLELVPAIIRDTDDDAMLRDALLENLHRSQLNPIEEANAYQQLMTDFGYTQQELSDRIKRSRPQIANSLRLLKLPPTVQRKLAAGVISAGHARALLGLPNAALMEALSERIISEGLSVRTTEEIVALGEVSEGVAAKKRARRAPRPLSENASAVVDRLTDLFDTRVTVLEGKRKGRITIEYAGTEDLERITQVIAGLRRQEF